MAPREHRLRTVLRAIDDLSVPSSAGSSRCFAGVPTNFVIGSRGCVGDCAYCCIRAFAHAQGGLPYRLRTPTAIAGEIVDLSSEKGARAIFLEDDLFVLPAESRAVERIQALERSLANLGTPKCAYWAKARPDTLTPAVLAASTTSLLNQVIALNIGIQVHQSLFPGDDSDALAREVQSLTTNIHVDTVATLRKIFDFSARAEMDDVTKIRTFAVEMGFETNNRDIPWRKECERYNRLLGARGRKLLLGTVATAL